MCGRYVLYEPKEIFDRYDVPQQSGLELKDNYNTAPGQFMPVITNSVDGRRVEVMKWGLVPHWAKDQKIGYKLINARSESVFDKPMWRGAVSTYRCIVPARGFYEWKKPGAGGGVKQPFYIHPARKELLSFAGIFSYWEHPHDGPLLSYSILTTAPNAEMADIHDRMPVLLHEQDEAAWLDPALKSRADLERFLAPAPDGSLKLYPVSPDVNTPKNNDSHLLEQVP